MFGSSPSAVVLRYLRPLRDAKTLAPILRQQIDRNANLMTDEAAYYTKVGREFASHGVVRLGIAVCYVKYIIAIFMAGSFA